MSDLVNISGVYHERVQPHVGRPFGACSGSHFFQPEICTPYARDDNERKAAAHYCPSYIWLSFFGTPYTPCRLADILSLLWDVPVDHVLVTRLAPLRLSACPCQPLPLRGVCQM
jgi:hypothetical protein